MLRFIARRFLQTIPVLFIIATLTFFLMKMTKGGPFDTEKATTPEIKKQLEAHYGLNKPVWEQYVNYVGNLVKGNLGPSFKYAGWDVTELIAGAFPVSLELGCYALAVALTIGMFAGFLAALRPNSASDYVPMSLATLGICLPTFVMGPLLILTFGVTLGWFNSSGWFFLSDRVLPALTLGGYYAAYTSRIARTGMIEILSQDFIRTARAKGATEWRVIFKHALKGAIQPVVTLTAPVTASMVTGSFIVEKIFDIPGLGRFFVTAAFNRDLTLVVGLVLFYATLIVTLNLIADVVLVWLNPRLRFE
jgi:oligopeptide transport system permease protein